MDFELKNGSKSTPGAKSSLIIKCLEIVPWRHPDREGTQNGWYLLRYQIQCQGAQGLKQRAQEATIG